MTFVIGDRLSYSGELCTIKFVGDIPPWPNDVAVGVEWDNVQKGKHDGSYKGKKYFETSGGSHSGSFLKAVRKHDGTQTFYEALVETYGASVESKEIKIGSKVVESYGFEKLQRLQSDFSYLKNISLSRKQMAGTTLKEEQLIKDHLVNLRDLDLSFNLLSSWSQVIHIVRNLNLRGLKLVGNRFSKDYEVEDMVPLEILDLSFTKVTQNVLEVIPRNFPQIKQLHISDNELKDLGEWLKQLVHLNSLDISLNNFDQIPKVLEHTRIETLNISDNKIKITKNDVTLPEVQTLDIRRNEISKWEEMNFLNDKFPNLISLRINGNPIFDNLTVDEMELNIIARFDKLKTVNGTDISEDERTNAELYFISKGSSATPIDQSRLEKLAHKHKVKLEKPRGVHEDNINSRLVNLKFRYQDRVVAMNTLNTIEILKLKGIISRFFKISYVDMELSYLVSSSTETINNDLSLVSSYEFEDGQEIYVQRTT